MNTLRTSLLLLRYHRRVAAREIGKHYARACEWVVRHESALVWLVVFGVSLCFGIAIVSMIIHS